MRAPSGMFRIPFLGFFFLLSLLPAVARAEPQGIVIYQEPATTYTEAMEYRSFHQDNALYSTIVTSDGQRKQVKSGGVLAVVPYPPAGFDIYFADTAKAAIAKLGTMEDSYPAVQGQLEQVRGKWVRALSVFQQEAKRSQGRIPRPAASVNPQVAPAAAPVFPSVGRTASRAASVDGTLTTRVEVVGRKVIGSGSRLLGVADRTFSVWTFFVALPALVIVLLLIVICMAMRPPVTRLPPGRPVH